MVAFFLCGTPSNHEGFQFVELGPGKLPGSPGSYLDKAPGEAIESHRFEFVSVEGQRFIEYCRTLRINPNDSAANRGAYVAAGCLIDQRLPMHALANCVDIVSEICGAVRSVLNAERSFPPGYRLRDFEYRGAPLEERLAHQSSPLLLADVLMQALNNEGVFAGGGAKQLTLAPEEVIATDVSRYQLYSAQGGLEPLLSIERDRSQLLEMTKQAAAAAAAIDELRNEWSSLQQAIGDGAARVLAKSEALHKLAGDMERAVEQHLALSPHSPGDYQVDAPVAWAPERRQAPSGAGLSLQERITSARKARASALHARPRPRRNDAVRLPRWAAVVGYGLVGATVAVLLFAWWGGLLPPDQSVLVESAPVASPAEQAGSTGANSVEPRPNDVAKERAALDAVPED